MRNFVRARQLVPASVVIVMMMVAGPAAQASRATDLGGFTTITASLESGNCHSMDLSATWASPVANQAYIAWAATDLHTGVAIGWTPTIAVGSTDTSATYTNFDYGIAALAHGKHRFQIFVELTSPTTLNLVTGYVAVGFACTT